MNRNNQRKGFSIVRAIKKLFLSAFVMVTFVLYALHKPASSTADKTAASLPQTGAQPAQTLVPTTPSPTDTVAPQQDFVPDNNSSSLPTFVPPTATAIPPTAAPQSNTVAQSGLRDGTYTGQQEDAQWGLLRVQVTIQNGKITNVKVPEYPSDRRTSVFINSQALPWLQQEVIQAQSANVDLISGATLTSEAFQMSLQTALDQAKGAL